MNHFLKIIFTLALVSQAFRHISATDAQAQCQLAQQDPCLIEPRMNLCGEDEGMGQSPTDSIKSMNFQTNPSMDVPTPTKNTLAFLLPGLGNEASDDDFETALQNLKINLRVNGLDDHSPYDQSIEEITQEYEFLQKKNLKHKNGVFCDYLFIQADLNHFMTLKTENLETCCQKLNDFTDIEFLQRIEKWYQLFPEPFKKLFPSKNSLSKKLTSAKKDLLAKILSPAIPQQKAESIAKVKPSFTILAAEKWLTKNNLPLNLAEDVVTHGLNGVRRNISQLKTIRTITQTTSQLVAPALYACIFGNGGKPLNLDKNEQKYIRTISSVYASAAGIARVKEATTARIKKSASCYESKKRGGRKSSEKVFTCDKCNELCPRLISAKNFPLSFQQILQAIQFYPALPLTLKKTMNIARHKAVLESCNGDQAKWKLREMKKANAEEACMVYCVFCEMKDMTSHLSADDKIGKINRAMMHFQEARTLAAIMCSYYESLYEDILAGNLHSNVKKDIIVALKSKLEDFSKDLEHKFIDLDGVWKLLEGIKARCNDLDLMIDESFNSFSHDNSSNSSQASDESCDDHESLEELETTFV